MATDRFEIVKRMFHHSASGTIANCAWGSGNASFMPVGTQAVKAMSPLEMEELGCEILLGNTYHLNDRPGPDLIERRGGLHSFMGWDGSILTDSGGYQVFSLGERNTITDEGFRLNHTRMVVRILSDLGSRWKFNVNWAQILPWCLMNVRRIRVKRITLAKLCEGPWIGRLFAETPRQRSNCFWHCAEGVFADLRESCAKALVEMDFEGYAIGGVSVGEPEDLILRGVDDTAIHLPEQKPRYLMGVEMAQMVESVARGVDMFDCVMPTRQARNGTVSTRRGRYPVKAAVYRDDERPLEEGCSCYACKVYTFIYSTSFECGRNFRFKTDNFA